MSVRQIYTLLLLLFPVLLVAQQPAGKLYGIVTNEKEELLIGASVQWVDTALGTVTDTLGRFWLPRRTQEATLLIRYVGYQPAQVSVLPGEDSLWLEVSGVLQIKEVTVAEHRFDNSVSTLGTRNVESIHRKELRKAFRQLLPEERTELKRWFRTQCVCRMDQQEMKALLIAMERYDRR